MLSRRLLVIPVPCILSTNVSPGPSPADAVTCTCKLSYYTITDVGFFPIYYVLNKSNTDIRLICNLYYIHGCKHLHTNTNHGTIVKQYTYQVRFAVEKTNCNAFSHEDYQNDTGVLSLQKQRPYY